MKKLITIIITICFALVTSNLIADTYQSNDATNEKPDVPVQTDHTSGQEDLDDDEGPSSGVGRGC